MSLATITSKGQITIPVDVRRALNLQTGDRIDFVEIDGRYVLRPKTSSVKELQGFITKSKKSVSVEEMNRAIALMGERAELVIGLDTNVLVRYLAQDDAAQAAKVNALAETLTAQNQAFISQIMLVELVWVLRMSYDAPRARVVSVIEHVLESREFVVENEAVIRQALRNFATGRADFADCIIASSNRAAGCMRTVTFDRVAAKILGMKLL